MPFASDTLPTADAFDGTTVGKGFVTFDALNNTDEFAAHLILLTFKTATGLLVPSGSLRLVPGGVPAPSDCIPILAWDAAIAGSVALSGFNLPCRVPVPPGYNLEFVTAVLPEEATFTYWWLPGRVDTTL